MSHYPVAVFSVSPEDVEELLAPFNENTLDSKYLEFVVDEEGEFNEENGEVGYFENPKAKWDWYEIGGRWSNLLRLKNSFENCDQAQVRDVDFSPRQEVVKALERYWEINVECMPLTENESENDFYSVYSPEFYKERYGTKEEYVRLRSSFSTYAFVTPDGGWVAQGEMGWFGVGTDTKNSEDMYREKLEEMIRNNPYLWITIVDCHT